MTTFDPREELPRVPQPMKPFTGIEVEVQPQTDEAGNEDNTQHHV